MAARKAKSRAKSRHGGHRTGAGRKRKTATELRAEIVAETDKRICENLPQLIENMLKLANGGYRRVERKYEPADVGDRAEAIKAGLVGERLSLVEKKVSIAEPDRAANIYLIDRVLGKPKQSVEVIASDDGKPPRINIPAVDNRPEPEPEG